MGHQPASRLERARELYYTTRSPTLAQKKKATTPRLPGTHSRTLLPPCVPQLPCTTGRLIPLKRYRTLGLDAAAIFDTGSWKAPHWVMALLLEENWNRVCLVIAPPRCVSNPRYMRSHLLTGATGLEGKTLLDHSDVSSDVSGRQWICGTTQGLGVMVKSQHSLAL